MKINNIINASRTLLVLTAFVAIAAGQDTKERKAVHGGDTPKKIHIKDEKAAVPMEIYGRKPVVDVKINGHGPFKFFLDTGAGATVLDQKLADELKLPTDGQTKIGDPSDPQGITANRDKIEDLEVGGATFSGVIGVSWDRSPLYKEGAPRGVLGMPLFRELLLTIDYPKNQVVITKGSLASGGKDILEYEYSEHGLFGVPIKVGAADMVATLDTGSPGGLSFPSSYIEKLPLEDKPKEIGRGKTVAGEAIIYGAKLKDTVRLGNNVFERPDITFFDRLVHLNIGYGLVSQFAITIDQKNRRMKFDRSLTTAPAAALVPAASKTEKYGEYTGIFGERRITAENGDLYLQRLSGPQGEGPKIKLVEISKDAFAMTGTTQVRLKFVRDPRGDVSQIEVLNQSGEWETAKRK